MLMLIFCSIIISSETLRRLFESVFATLTLVCFETSTTTNNILLSPLLLHGSIAAFSSYFIFYIFYKNQTSILYSSMNSVNDKSTKSPSVMMMMYTPRTTNCSTRGEAARSNTRLTRRRESLISHSINQIPLSWQSMLLYNNPVLHPKAVLLVIVILLTSSSTAYYSAVLSSSLVIEITLGLAFILIGIIITGTLYYLGGGGVPSVLFSRHTTDNNNAESPDVIIIGAGTAGCAAAWTLAEANYNVLIIEKNWIGSDRIVGELLQPGGVCALHALGLSSDVLPYLDAVKINGYVIIENSNNSQVKLPYPSDVPSTLYEQVFGTTKSKNNNLTGRGFHNKRFVNKLREKIASHSRITCVTGVATDVSNNSVTYKSSSDDSTTKTNVVLSSKLVIVADGMWSSLRPKDKISTTKPTTTSHFVGIKIHHGGDNDDLLLNPSFGHVYIPRDSKGLVLMYPISSTEVRVLIDIPGPNLIRPKEKLVSFLVNTIEDLASLPSVGKSEILKAIGNRVFKVMPNKTYSTSTNPSNNNIMYLGDSGNMRHPLTGSGMTVALLDVLLLKSMILQQKEIDIEEFNIARTTSHATTINVLANALYQVFCNDTGSDVKKALTNACVSYLSLLSAGPVGLLSCVSTNVNVLVLHFTMVVVYGVLRSIILLRLTQAYRMVQLAIVILIPLLSQECDKSSTTITALFTHPVTTNILDLIFDYKNKRPSDF